MICFLEYVAPGEREIQIVASQDLIICDQGMTWAWRARKFTRRRG